ncbi:hypothetical protein [Pilimelia columellifera]|uniref:Uncharacterized protein n=1 Tax=Pilimelia columellifera subsp. columellifera TaxID=706583 RepID=A0ABN3NCH1_9ACTN
MQTPLPPSPHPPRQPRPPRQRGVAPPAAATPWNRQRVLLGVLAGAVILMLVGGLGVAVTLWDRANPPAASVPDAAVDNYLRVLLVDRDLPASRELACPDVARLAAIEDLLDEARDREREFQVAVRVSWGALAVSQDGAALASVETDLTVAGLAEGQVRSSSVESWRFGLIWDGQWRVCGANPV